MKCILLSDYTELATSRVTQRQSIAYSGTLAQLRYYLSQLSGDVEMVEIGDKKAIQVFKAVTIIHEPRMITLEVSNPYSL